MKVTVKLFATLTRSVSESIVAQYPQGIRSGFPLEVELTEGSTVADLLAHLDLPEAQVKMVFVNNRGKKPDYRLKAGDKVGIFPPIAGG